VLIPGGHFDPYLGQFPRASDAAVSWFCQHLNADNHERPWPKPRACSSPYRSAESVFWQEHTDKQDLEEQNVRFVLEALDSPFNGATQSRSARMPSSEPTSQEGANDQTNKQQSAAAMEAVHP
jgi:hypothetical protein